jgi:hypothetical protein
MTENQVPELNILREASERLSDIALPPGRTWVSDTAAMYLSMHLAKIADLLPTLLDVNRHSEEEWAEWYAAREAVQALVEGDSTPLRVAQ